MLPILDLFIMCRGGMHGSNSKVTDGFCVIHANSDLLMLVVAVEVLVCLWSIDTAINHLSVDAANIYFFYSLIFSCMAAWPCLFPVCCTRATHLVVSHGGAGKQYLGVTFSSDKHFWASELKWFVHLSDFHLHFL